METTKLKLFVLLMSLAINSVQGQTHSELVDRKDSIRYLRLGKNRLLRALRDHPMYTTSARGLLRKWTCLPIPSFVVSEKGSTYDGNKIWQCLSPNKDFPLEYVLAIEQGEYKGSTENISAVNFGEKEGWYFDDAGPDGVTIGAMHARSYDLLKKHDPEFIFSVRYFRNSWWFVKDKSVYVIDLETLRVDQADEYIETICSIEVIRKMALGERIFCK